MTSNKNIILVNPDDEEIGIIEKIRGHKYGMLHRAFSVVIFRMKNKKIETLLQQRNRNKYHGGGLWTNTCCSHPYPGEEIQLAAQQRLKEEMGIEVKLQPAGKFHYIAQLDRGMTENEIDHVFYGIYDADTIPFNREEVEDYEWMDVSTLHLELNQHPAMYSPWFKQALELALIAYEKSL